MRHKIIFLSLFTILFIQSYSQSDFRNGYVVTNTNDTIYGLIDYKGNIANSKVCIFKNDMESEKLRYTPNEIKAYRFINNKYYISKSVKKGDSIELLFLEYLINGIVDVYYYRDNAGEHYLVDKGDGQLIELTNEEKEVYVNNVKYRKTSKKYIGVLKYIFRESPVVARKVERISLNHKSLIAMANEYHNEVCSDEECIIYEKLLPKIKIQFGPVVGLNVSSISSTNEFSEYYHYYFQNSDFNHAIHPSIGFFFKVNMPYWNERLYFQYEGTYSRWNLKTKNAYVDPIYFLNHNNDIAFTQNTYNSTGLIRYEFPKRKIRPVLQAGGFINHFFKIDFSRKLDVKWSSGDTFKTGEFNENPFSKSDYGISIGIGCIIAITNTKDVFFDLKYQKGYGLLKHLNTNNISFNFSIPVSTLPTRHYKLGKKY